MHNQLLGNRAVICSQLKLTPPYFVTSLQSENTKTNTLTGAITTSMTWLVIAFHYRLMEDWWTFTKVHLFLQRLLMPSSSTLRVQHRSSVAGDWPEMFCYATWTPGRYLYRVRLPSWHWYRSLLLTGTSSLARKTVDWLRVLLTNTNHCCNMPSNPSKTINWFLSLDISCLP